MRMVIQLLKDSIHSYIKDRGPRLGASLGFYSLLSLSPTLILLVSILTPLAGKELTRFKIILFTRSYLGEVGSEFIEGILSKATEVSFGWQAFLGLTSLFMASTLVFYELQNMVNDIWKIPEQKARIRRTIYRRLRSFVVVISMAVSMVVLFFTRTFAVASTRYLKGWLPDSFPLLSLMEWFLGLIVLFFVFSFVFAFLPERKLKIKQIWPGALVSALLFAFGRHFIGLYLTRSQAASMYGVASSLVFFLFWVYYSGQVFLFGVEVSKVYAVKKYKIDLE